ncbi:class I tRNA ligase family protein [Streptomyces sp. NPDC005336]|uniref:class I tRNA ligase family protein n=1 Tax=Streptomyces sp. NPDC005336 TaxID=3157035 RepID=UPI0033A0CD2E
MGRTPLDGQKYFLTPLCLFPGGRAHLGRITGPLLKMDVLRRHILRSGGKVMMISVSDDHEAYVLVRRHADRVTPERVANGNHQLIRSDLAAQNIAYDDLINPLDDWAGRHEEINHVFLAEIVAQGSTATRSEPTPVLDSEQAGAHSNSLRPRVDQPVVSGRRRGQCPR